MTAEVMESSRPERTHKVLSLPLKFLFFCITLDVAAGLIDRPDRTRSFYPSVWCSWTSLQEVNLRVWIQLFFCISNKFGSQQQIISSHLAGTLSLARPSRVIRFYDRHIWFDMGFFMLDAFHDATLPIYPVVQPGVSCLAKDISTCGQEGVGIDQPTLWSVMTHSFFKNTFVMHEY